MSGRNNWTIQSRREVRRIRHRSPDWPPESPSRDPSFAKRSHRRTSVIAKRQLAASNSQVPLFGEMNLAVPGVLFVIVVEATGIYCMEPSVLPFAAWALTTPLGSLAWDLLAD